MTDNRTYWYNFDTEEHDYRDAPNTYAEFMPYVPKMARALFSLHELTGKDVSDAYLDVMRRCVGDKP